MNAQVKVIICGVGCAKGDCSALMIIEGYDQQQIQRWRLL